MKKYYMLLVCLKSAVWIAVSVNFLIMSRLDFPDEPMWRLAGYLTSIMTLTIALHMLVEPFLKLLKESNDEN